MAEIEGVCGRLAALRISDQAISVLLDANKRCQQALDHNDMDEYYRENEYFHHFIYKYSGNSFLEQEALRLHRRLKPYRRHQLRVRGRMAQSMAEHIAIVSALQAGDSDTAAKALRGHVAIQGEKFHLLMSSLKTATK